MQNSTKLIASITKLQSALNKAKDDIAASTFSGTSGNGLVSATLDGNGVVTSLEIKDEVLAEGGETVAALVRIALNAANAEKDTLTKSKLSAIGAGALPFGMKVPGL